MFVIKHELGAHLQASDLGRKSPLGSNGWISAPERRESAISGHSPTVGERLPNTESGHPEAI